MVTRALICGLLSMILSYFLGYARDLATLQLVTAMALSVIIPSMLRPDPKP